MLKEKNLKSLFFKHGLKNGIWGGWELRLGWGTRPPWQGTQPRRGSMVWDECGPWGQSS